MIIVLQIAIIVLYCVVTFYFMDHLSVLFDNRIKISENLLETINRWRKKIKDFFHFFKRRIYRRNIKILEEKRTLLKEGLYSLFGIFAASMLLISITKFQEGEFSKMIKSYYFKSLICAVFLSRLMYVVNQCFTKLNKSKDWINITDYLKKFFSYFSFLCLAIIFKQFDTPIYILISIMLLIVFLWLSFMSTLNLDVSFGIHIIYLISIYVLCMLTIAGFFISDNPSTSTEEIKQIFLSLQNSYSLPGYLNTEVKIGLLHIIQYILCKIFDVLILGTAINLISDNTKGTIKSKDEPIV